MDLIIKHSFYPTGPLRNGGSNSDLTASAFSLWRGNHMHTNIWTQHINLQLRMDKKFLFLSLSLSIFFF